MKTLKFLFLAFMVMYGFQSPAAEGDIPVKAFLIAAPNSDELQDFIKFIEKDPVKNTKINGR